MSVALKRNEVDMNNHHYQISAVGKGLSGLTSAVNGLFIRFVNGFFPKTPLTSDCQCGTL